MALIRCNFSSNILQVKTSMNVILPERTPGIIGKKNQVPAGTFPVLWLFHGLSDDENSWLRNTSIERYVDEYGIAVVMPDAQRSYYNDMAAGGSYWRFFSEELITKARSFFPLSHRRKDNFTAGLSMGGFGAFKLALNKPEFVSAAGSFSGVVDILDRFGMPGGNREEFARMFGSPDEVHESMNDLPWLLSRSSFKGLTLPSLYQCCGTEDFLYQLNKNFLKTAQESGIHIHYEEDSGFAHTWDYWDLKIRSFLEWLVQQDLSGE
ncbi:MAG: esterase family protein [Bacteroidetes bacterium]|nr:esterase family protein [Bacteroidota bacterium]